MSAPLIEGYTELVQVAQGGFGIVYRGRREALDQDVAVKVLSLPNLSERDLDRFTRECRAAGNLSWHPHVVAVYDSGTTTGGQPYLAMEYLDNGSLADRLTATGPLPWQEVVDIGIQVAGALGAAHAAGTLHRDMKPENILVGHFGEALLADFGIAAVEGHTRTATGHASFTVTHVAPEILHGQRPDERTDLYGLASTLFTLLTGTTPFATDPDEPIATVITRVLTEPAPHLTGIPAPLADLVERALSKEPDDRPQNAQALGEALQQIQRDNALAVTTLRLARAARPATTKDAAEPALRDAEPTITVAPSTPATEAPLDPDPNATITIAPVTPPAGDPPAGSTPLPTPPPAEPEAQGEGRKKAPVLIGLGVVAVLALVGGALALLSGGDSGGGGGGAPANEQPVVPVDDLLGAEGNPRTGTLTLPHDVVQRIAATDEFLWVAGDDGVLNQYEAVSGDLVSSETVMSDKPTRVAATDAATWVFAEGESIRRDTVTGEILGLDGFPGLQDVATSDNAVWVLAAGLNGEEKTRLHRLDPDSGQQVEAFDLGPGGGLTHYFAVAATSDEVWVVRLGDPTSVQRLDPDTGDVLVSVTDSELSDVTSFSPSDLAIAGATVWVANSTISAPRDGGGLVRVEGTTSEGFGLPVRFTLFDVVATSSDVWATSSSTPQSSVLRIEPATNAVVDTTPIEGQAANGDTVGPQAIAATDTDVWVAAGTTIRHIDPR